MRSLWALLLLLHTALAATSHRNVEQQTLLVVTSQPDKLSLSPSNDLRNDDADNENNDKEDDDYYSDNEQTDAVDEMQKFKNWNRVFPTSTPTPTRTTTPRSTPTPRPTPSSLAWWSSPQSLRRVPRHPQHFQHDNRLNGDAVAAFQEVSFYSSTLGGRTGAPEPGDRRMLRGTHKIILLICRLCRATNLPVCVWVRVCLCFVERVCLNICQIVCVGGLKCYECIHTVDSIVKLERLCVCESIEVGSIYTQKLTSWADI